MLTQDVIEKLLKSAQANGADFAELFIEDTETTSLQMVGGKVDTAKYSRVGGAGVRVLSGTKSAYAYTSDMSVTALHDTARAAAAALACAEKREVTDIVFTMRRYSTPQVIPFANVENDRRVHLIRDAASAASAVSSEITQVVAGYTDKVQRVTIANSEGLLVTDERPRTRGYVRAVAMADGVAQTGFEAPGCCHGFEAYRSVIDLDEAGRQAATAAVKMLHAPECPAGVFPVVIDGGFGGVIFHEACGHALEATSVGRGNSVFCNKLGQTIASPCVSAVDDGTLPNEWGSINVDDEGVPSQRNLLIENGVLRGYLIDRLGSRRIGMPVTGSARRQSYAFAATSRMTNTFICPGTDDDAEMIATMGDGLYAKRMGGGSVNPATGEFNFTVAEGYLVRNGVIVSPVRGAMLIGHGEEILTRIDRVGKHMWMAQGMCGSISGQVPTNVGQPRIRVTGITVGGKGGAL